MRALTHQITGTALAAAAVSTVDARGATAAVLIAAAWIGSLLPDADLAGARVHRPTRIERRVPLMWLAAKVLRLPFRLLSLLPHRGPTHSVLAFAAATALSGAAVSVIAPELAPAAAAGAAIGYGAHIAADACTPSGVPLWSPFSRRRRWLPPARARIKTGSAREYAAAAAMSVLLIAAALPLLG